MESGENIEKKRKTKRDGCVHGGGRDTCQKINGKVGVGMYVGGRGK